MKSPEDIELLRQLTDELLSDFRSADSQLKQNSSQYHRRQFTRTVFALVEGVCSIYRQKAKAAIQMDLSCRSHNLLANKDKAEHHQKQYDEIKDCYHELVMLSETVFTPDDSGKMVEQPQRISFINSVAFSIRSWSKHMRYFDCSHFFADNGWNQFRKAVKIRDRITHPKSIKDLTISDTDLTIIEHGCEWFILANHEILHSFKTRRKGESPSIERSRKSIIKM